MALKQTDFSCKLQLNFIFSERKIKISNKLKNKLLVMKMPKCMSLDICIPFTMNLL